MRKLSYNAICAIVISCLLGGYLASFFFVRRLRPKELKKEFAAINSVYDKGQYGRAIAAYESLASRYDMECMSLYYNLGNAYCKTNNLGEAILYYTKAQCLAPRDKDVAANLRIAQAKAGVAAPPRMTYSPRALGRTLLKPFSLFEGFAVLLTFRWLLIICVVLAVFFEGKRRGFVRLSIVLAVLFYASLAATVFKAHAEKSHRQGVVLEERCSVRVSPREDAAASRVLREGISVEVKGRRDGWWKIATDDGKVGWVEEEELGGI